MDLVGIALNLILGALLVAALMYGVRLNRNLTALREGQAGFARAVQELNLAAARAENGLEILRTAGREAHDELHDRILKARELKGDLERLMARADRLPLQAQPAPTPQPRQPAPEPRRREPHAGEMQSIRDMAARAPRPAVPPAPRAASRGLDEDLFEVEAAALARRVLGDHR